VKTEHNVVRSAKKRRNSTPGLHTSTLVSRLISPDYLSRDVELLLFQTSESDFTRTSASAHCDDTAFVHTVWWLLGYPVTRLLSWCCFESMNWQSGVISAFQDTVMLGALPLNPSRGSACSSPTSSCSRVRSTVYNVICRCKKIFKGKEYHAHEGCCFCLTVFVFLNRSVVEPWTITSAIFINFHQILRASSKCGRSTLLFVDQSEVGSNFRNVQIPILAVFKL